MKTLKNGDKCPICGETLRGRSENELLILSLMCDWMYPDRVREIAERTAEKAGRNAGRDSSAAAPPLNDRRG